ncbi:MAG: AAA family ATPase [Okeania sp. SIO2F4]|uniref:ATP-dependent nuclease n=1 Tax=Okeania sp. SIO2F4 TaxID=2607790 RepID=UPI00142C0FAE|nr:AAA family ATPase [Okeania sp. SIO2F4]NES02961.1 AAA family ATPase [Okeania sp. SIO2F4]
MYISKFQIFNYKSFRDSGWLEFQPGINIIVGTNNSGKTALLESLGLEFKDNPYRNIRMRDFPDSDLPDKSVANITFRLDKSEILKFIDGKTYISNSDENVLTIFQEWFDEAKDIEVTVSSKNNIPSIVISDFPKDILDRRSDHLLNIGKPGKVLLTKIGDSGKHELKEKEIHQVKVEQYIRNLVQVILDKLKRQIYRFNAERFHIGNCPFGSSLILKPDASNLAEVIYQIQFPGKKNIYPKLNKYLNILFPEIKKVSAHSNDQKSLEILVWSPKASEEDDINLALKLADCGTGVSQVLAILYVVVTASEPKIIIIDEPQSFLHPNLIRKLINIFKEFPQHQYFIATHSPIVISEANPATILQLSYSDGETKTKIINSKETTELRSLLKNLGVSLSDVFGADAILWVEGPTEELCFPQILEKFGDSSMKGIQILAVKNTGDLEGKRAHIIFDIYDKLSGGNTLFPPAIGFILDSENRSEKEKQDISRRGKEKVKFLERCTYENYLLHPQAILEVLQKENSSLQIPLADIKNYIDADKNKNDKLFESQEDRDNLISEIFSKFSVKYQKTKYYRKITNTNENFLLDPQAIFDVLKQENPSLQITLTDIQKYIDEAKEKKWQSQVNGANLISEIFSKFSDNTVEYQKTKHSLEITNWLLEHEPNYLQKLAEFLKGIIEA